MDNVDETLTPDFVMNKLKLTKRECNSRIGKLMNLDLADISDNQYRLTKFGNEVYESLKMMETATRMHRMVDTANIWNKLLRKAI
jgi:predicted transcriptional regulator